MKYLSGRYLVDKIEWRGGATNSNGNLLPLEFWFDVDMSDEFWIGHVKKNLPPTLEMINNHRRINMLPELTESTPIDVKDYMTERESLEEFFWEYLDKVFYIEPVFWRIRKLDEIRNDEIDDILGIEKNRIDEHILVNKISK
jgi:hypothetical protein